MGNQKDDRDNVFQTHLSKQIALYDQIKVLKRNFDKTPIVRRTRGYISKRIESLDSDWNSIREIDCILRASPEYSSSKYATETWFDELDEYYSTFSGELSDCLYVLDHPIIENNVIADQNPENVQLNQQVIQPPAFRLPQISLPTFFGDYASWAAFSDMFTSLIHSNNALTNVQKLHYLKSNLRGSAANLLRNTNVTNDNYAIAWEMLKSRFANKRALVDAQLKILTNQPFQHTEIANNIRDLIDTTQESLNALRGCEINVDNWDPIVLFLLVKKLCRETHKAWESDQQGKEGLSTLKDFIIFLEHRFRMLETLSDRHPSTSTNPQLISRQPLNRQLKTHTTNATSSSKLCPLCNENHYLRSCNTFLNMSVADRQNTAKQHRCCFNCLVQGHFLTECKNKMRCQKCNKNHHTLLHQIDDLVDTLSSSEPNQTLQRHQTNLNSSLAFHHPSTAGTSSHINPFSDKPNKDNCTSHVASFVSFNPARVLLATAMIHVVSSFGQSIPLRALIDQGSEVSLITTSAAQLLRLNRKNINIPLSGIGSASAGRIRSLVQLDIRSPHQPSFVLRTNALVLNTITGLSPRAKCPIGRWSHIENLTIADPSFANPGKIDVLLGADVFNQIILPGVIRGSQGDPLAQSTVFGWILYGRIEATTCEIPQSNITTLHTCIDIDDRLKSFWEIEEICRDDPHHTEEEIQCEAHFINTHSKSSNGRYVVRIPLQTPAVLGESYTSALQRFNQLERSLGKYPTRKAAYIEFMREYHSLGHMKPIATVKNNHNYIIPHHAIFKESSSTTKTRVVFDASNKSSNGLSLNNIMLNGPKIQDDLSTILLRWRKYPIAINADVEKMYRQILIHPEDRHFQHILWRESPDSPLIEYELQTVTYGTACAPYLAVRTLRQLAIDNTINHPNASKIIEKDFYVDDLLTGAYTIEEAITIYKEVSKVMSSSGFNLRKWVSNHPELLREIPLSDRDIQYPLDLNLNHTVTALGIVWNPSTDTFNFSFKLQPFDRAYTKRNILSDISTLFDPLGWLAPIILRSKILMQ